jgi:hypothetical protein
MLIHAHFEGILRSASRSSSGGDMVKDFSRLFYLKRKGKNKSHIPVPLYASKRKKKVRFSTCSNHLLPSKLCGYHSLELQVNCAFRSPRGVHPDADRICSKSCQNSHKNKDDLLSAMILDVPLTPLPVKVSTSITFRSMLLNSLQYQPLQPDFGILIYT